MNQKERQEIQEIKKHQFEMSRDISRILSILEGDEKMGIMGYGNRLNNHYRRLNAIENELRLIKQQKAMAIFIISSLGATFTWLVNFLAGKLL